MGDVVLDCMHETCPIPLIKALKELEKMEIGDIVTIQTDHSCTIKNIVEWAKNKGHFVDFLKVGDGEWEIYIEKGE